MANWSFELADHLGVAIAELATGAGRSLTFTRNAYPEAAIVISHDDDAAYELFTALRNGVPTLRAYRDGVLRFHGHLAPFGEQLEGDAHLSLVFRGPFARLIGYGQSRGRFTAASKVFTATDAGQIAKTLIDETTAAGVATTGNIEATKTRDRTYQYANVGEAVAHLTRVLDGFDFEVSPIVYDSGNIGEFSVFANQGADLTDTVKFQYGPDTLRNVRSVSRQTEPPINIARVIGANGQAGLQTDAPSRATYGDWWVQESASDVTELATLNDKANALLRPNWIKVVGFSPDPTLAPLPWDDYWLGDTVSFYGRRGAFEEDLTARVDKITVVIDEEGNEAQEIEQPGADGAKIEAEVEVEVVTA